MISLTIFRKYAQIIGKVMSQNSIEARNFFPAGNNFDMDNYNKVVELSTLVPLIAYQSPPAKLTPSELTVCSVIPSIIIVTLLPDPVSLMVILELFCEIALTANPLTLTVPVVVILPVVASIDNGPTVSPFCTTKFPFAILFFPRFHIPR
jgi:hypothetical protein